MRIVAANWLFRSESVVLHPAMAVITDSYVSDYAAITDDMTLMEWLGGIIFLSAKEDLDELPEQVTLSQLKAYLLNDDMPRYAYHLSSVDIHSESRFSASLLVRLGEDFI